MKIRVFERFGKKKAEEIRDEIFLCEHEGVFIYFLDRKDESDGFTDKIRHRFLFRIVNFTKQEVTVQMENPCINCKTVTDYTKSVILYKVYRGNKTSITTDATRVTFASSNTHSYFDMYYDINPTDDIVDYYLVVVQDYAGNTVTKKLTSQRSLLSWFHTSIDRSTYE